MILFYLNEYFHCNLLIFNYSGFNYLQFLVHNPIRIKILVDNNKNNYLKLQKIIFILIKFLKN